MADSTVQCVKLATARKLVCGWHPVASVEDDVRGFNGQMIHVIGNYWRQHVLNRPGLFNDLLVITPLN